MAKADRLARRDERRIEAEGEYRAILIAALHETAAGQWGLFGHNWTAASGARIAPVLASLEELALEIDGIRRQFEMGPFELHQEFLASRGRVGPNAPGEPKQATAWLERIGA